MAIKPDKWGHPQNYDPNTGKYTNMASKLKLTKPKKLVLKKVKKNLTSVYPEGTIRTISIPREGDTFTCIVDEFKGSQWVRVFERK